MIDTVVLLLSSSSYTISHPEKFIPSARWASEKSRSNLGIISKQKATFKELRAGNYKPHLTLSHRIDINGRYDNILRIELSLPKLLFGNNFNELRLKDFMPVTEKLVAVLATMGIVTTVQALALTPVAAAHYSKNIILTDGSTPHFFISKIKEANVKLSLDVNQTDYRNSGHSFKWHCNSYEVVFYDKLKELQQDKNLKHDNLFKKFKRRKKFEILRMEVRLNKRQKMQQLFKALGIKSRLTLKNLFKPALSKKVLLYYLNEMEKKRPTLPDFKGDDKALLAALIVHNPDIAPKQIFQIVGFKQALELMDIRELRSMFGKHRERSWFRFLADIQKVKLPTKQQFDVVREQLVKFKAVKLI